jgi:hypothetical protein
MFNWSVFSRRKKDDQNHFLQVGSRQYYLSFIFQSFIWGTKFPTDVALVLFLFAVSAKPFLQVLPFTIPCQYMGLHLLDINTATLTSTAAAG